MGACKRSRAKSNPVRNLRCLDREEADYVEIHSDGSSAGLRFNWRLFVCIVGIVALTLVGLAWGVKSATRGIDIALLADGAGASDNSTSSNDTITSGGGPNPWVWPLFQDAYVKGAAPIDQVLQQIAAGLMAKGYP